MFENFLVLSILIIAFATALVILEMIFVNTIRNIKEIFLDIK
jgi:hypothetical protein